MKYQPPFKYGATPAVPGIHSDDADAAYVNGDPTTGEEGSIPPAEAFEHPLREIMAVITDAALVPSHTDLTQLLQAIKKLARAEVKLKTEGGGVAVYNGRDEDDFNHRIRSLRAGSNVTISIDTDGALLITATGGVTPGGDTASGLGVEIDAEAEANLAFQRIPAGAATRANADTMAWRKAADGVHETMTYAQLIAALDARISTYVTNNVTIGAIPWDGVSNPPLVNTLFCAFNGNSFADPPGTGFVQDVGTTFVASPTNPLTFMGRGPGAAYVVVTAGTYRLICHGAPSMWHRVA